MLEVEEPTAGTEVDFSVAVPQLLGACNSCVSAYGLHVTWNVLSFCPHFNDSGKKNSKNGSQDSTALMPGTH